MKKNRKIQIWFIALAITLFIASCEKDEIIVETFESNNPKVKKVTFKELSNDIKFVDAFSKISKNSLNNNSLSRTVMESQYNFTIDDYPAKVIELDSLTSYTFSINNETRTDSIFENLVVNHYNNGITKAAIFKYISDNSNPSSNTLVDIHNSKSFVGTTEITPIIYNDNDVIQRQTTVCFTSVGLLCDYGGRTHPAGERCGTTYWGTQTNCETIFTPDYYTSIVQIIEDYGNGNPGLGAGGSINEILSNTLSPEELTWWNHATQEEKQPILDYLNPNINDGNAWLATKEAIKTIKDGGEVDFENKIMIDSTFKNNQKAMCIYNKMRTINGFNKALAPFEGDNPDSFIKFKTETLPNFVRAETKEPNENNVIEIILNDCTSCENGINAQPNLLLAQTIIHEVLHAELFRQIIVAIGTGSYVHDYDTIVTALENSQYSKLAEYLRTTKDWSHNYMAENFRRAIARVTQEFDTNIPVGSRQIPLPLYTNLAWRGLMVYEDPITGNGVVAWMDLVGPNNSSPSQASQDVQNVINNYLSNNSNRTCQ